MLLSRRARNVDVRSWKGERDEFCFYKQSLEVNETVSFPFSALLTSTLHVRLLCSIEKRVVRSLFFLQSLRTRNVGELATQNTGGVSLFCWPTSELRDLPYSLADLLSLLSLRYQHQD
jgi:hypothetical protein